MQNYIQSIRSKVGHEKIILAFAGRCIFNHKGGSAFAKERRY